MAHPDPRRGGPEKGQRQHAGRTSEHSDAGMKNKSQGIAAKGPSPGSGPEAGNAGSGPSASGGHEHQRVAGGTGGTSGQSVKTGPSTQGTPPLKASTGKASKKKAAQEGDGADVSD